MLLQGATQSIICRHRKEHRTGKLGYITRSLKHVNKMYIADHISDNTMEMIERFDLQLLLTYSRTSDHVESMMPGNNCLPRHLVVRWKTFHQRRLPWSKT